MKKIFSLLLSGVVAASAFSTAFAAVQIGTSNPTVRIDNRELIFKDQKAVIDISQNRTLVPVRGVFEAMDSEVVWVEAEKKVIIISYDNLTRVELQINNPTMTVYNAVSLFHSDKSEVALETAPVIYNNRTMMPLRAVCEAMKGTVNWDGTTRTIDVKTKQYNKHIAKKVEEFGESYNLKDDVVNMTISANTDDVKKGDVAEILVNVTNTEKYKGTAHCGGMITMSYNMDNFRYLGAELVANGEVREDTNVTANPEFQGDSVRALFIVMGSPEDRGPAAADTGVYKLKFEALNDEGGEFALTDRTDSTRLMDCNLMYDRGTDTKDGIVMVEDFSTLDIDTTPIVIK